MHMPMGGPKGFPMLVASKTMAVRRLLRVSLRRSIHADCLSRSSGVG